MVFLRLLSSLFYHAHIMIVTINLAIFDLCNALFGVVSGAAKPPPKLHQWEAGGAFGPSSLPNRTVMYSKVPLLRLYEIATGSHTKTTCYRQMHRLSSTSY